MPDLLLEENRKYAMDCSQAYGLQKRFTIVMMRQAPRYVYIVEAPKCDAVMRKRLKVNIGKRLPFRLQSNMGKGRKLISEFDVLSIKEWNEHPLYGKYPLIELT